MGKSLSQIITAIGDDNICCEPVDGEELGDGSVVRVTLTVIRRRPLKRNPWLDKRREKGR